MVFKMKTYTQYSFECSKGLPFLITELEFVKISELRVGQKLVDRLSYKSESNTVKIKRLPREGGEHGQSSAVLMTTLCRRRAAAEGPSVAML